MESPLLLEADEIIHGARQAAYGDWTQNFHDIAVRWTQDLRGKLKEGAVIEPEEVAILMADLKIAREVHAHKHDNLVDGVGYLAIADALFPAPVLETK